MGEPEQQAVSPQQVKIGWGDKTISIVGLHTIVVMILVLALVYMGLLLREAVQGSNDAVRGLSVTIDKLSEIQAQQHVAITEEVRDAFGKMQVNQSRMADAMDAQTYLMTKTDAERKMYKLDMPDSLRRRIR